MRDLKASSIHFVVSIFIAGVWIFHGLFSKLLDGIPRHREIVGKVLGEGVADIATPVIGVFEILLGCWVLSGIRRRICAMVLTLGLVSMNTLEILLARELLVSAAGMVALNLCFIGIIWWWATREIQPTQPS